MLVGHGYGHTIGAIGLRRVGGEQGQFRQQLGAGDIRVSGQDLVRRLRQIETGQKFGQACGVVGRVFSIDSYGQAVMGRLAGKGGAKGVDKGIERALGHGGDGRQAAGDHPKKKSAHKYENTENGEMWGGGVANGKKSTQI